MMPRGTRAIHGAEVDVNLHPSGQKLHTHISVVEPWLAVTCWCEQDVVAVEQWVLRHLGATLSCGRPGCESPDGDRSVGERLYLDELARAGVHHTNSRSEIERGLFVATNEWQPRAKPLPRTWIETNAEKAKKAPPVVRTVSRWSVGRGTSRVEVSLRREEVEREWKRLGNRRAVAEMLGLPEYTVNNDLTWLQRNGRI